MIGFLSLVASMQGQHRRNTDRDFRQAWRGGYSEGRQRGAVRTRERSCV